MVQLSYVFLLLVFLWCLHSDTVNFWKSLLKTYSSAALLPVCRIAFCNGQILAKIEGQRRGHQRVRWLDSITDLVDLSKLWDIVQDREVWCAVVHGVAKSWTQISNWIITPNGQISYFFFLVCGFPIASQGLFLPFSYFCQQVAGIKLLPHEIIKYLSL